MSGFAANARGGTPSSSSLPQLWRDVVELKTVIRSVEHERAAQGVGARHGHHVVHEPAARRLGGHAAGLIRQLLEHERVVIDLDATITRHRSDVHAVDQIVRFRPASAAVHARRRLLKRAGAAHVDVVLNDGGDQAADRPHVVGVGQYVEHFAGHDRLIEHGGRVQQRRLARHRHRLLDGIDLQDQVRARRCLCVDDNVLDEIGAKPDELAFHAVAAGDEAGKLIGSTRICHGDLIAADRARVRGRDRHTRKHGAGRIGGCAADARRNRPERSRAEPGSGTAQQIRVLLPQDFSST